ncbi:MAG: hypothetical protein QNK92_13170 [Amylibacter sp.]
MADHFEFHTSKGADVEPPTVALSIGHTTIEGKDPQDIVDFTGGKGASEEEYSKSGAEFIDDVFAL